MFGRKKEKSQPVESEPVADKTPQAPSNPKYTPPKGRPTPTRKEREEARRRPLVVKDRKAAKQADQKAAAELRQRQNEAMRTGDDRYLPPMHQGKQRRFVRDYVDARHNVGDYLLHVFIISLLIYFVAASMGTHDIAVAVMSAVYAYILIFIIDLWLLWRKLKGILQEKYKQVQPRTVSYIFGRITMMRRFRQPKPQVKYGQYPS